MEFDPELVSFDCLVQQFLSEPRAQRAQPLAADDVLRRPQTRIAIFAQSQRQQGIASRVLANAGFEERIPVVPPTKANWHQAEATHQHFIRDDKDFEDWSQGLDGDDDSDGGSWGSGPGTAWGL